MRTAKERFLQSSRRVYCFADSPATGKTLLDAGARILQLRNKTAGDATFERMAAELLACVRRFEDAVLIVNDRVEIAVAVGADGIHVGQTDLACAEVVQRVPPHMIIGVSARYPDIARRAAADGADYLGTGSVFATDTKPDAAVIGLDGLAAVVQAVRIPVVAIGGITAANIQPMLACNARYAAVIAAINDAADPAAAYRKMEALAAQTR
jgi:thiamine-phosphate diphosphorylase